MLRFLFPYKVYPKSVSLMLLCLRVLFGGLMMWHGILKIENFVSLVDNFPNPIGLGSRFSLYLAIFAEVICSAAVIVGAFYRLALIPLICTMGVAMIIVHNGQSFAAKATIVPCSTSMLTPLTTFLSPYVFTKLSVLIINGLALHHFLRLTPNLVFLQ